MTDENFIRVQVRDEDEVVVQGEPTPDTIVVGDATEHYHLNTFEDIECVHCYEDHFHGQPSDQVTHTHARKQSYNNFFLGTCLCRRN